jgi:hypothetical protein
MHLKGGTKDHFMGFLAHAFPHLVEGYGRLYAGAYAAPGYVTQVREMIEMFKARHGLHHGAREDTADAPASTPNSQAPTPKSQGELFGNWELGVGN